MERTVRPNDWMTETRFADSTAVSALPARIPRGAAELVRQGQNGGALRLEANSFEERYLRPTALYATAQRGNWNARKLAKCCTNSSPPTELT